MQLDRHTDFAVRGLHHFAYKCKDAEETRHFYEDVLGLPLAHVMERRNIRSTTGQMVSFIHVFFQMDDGSFLAFFDLGDGKAPEYDSETPKFTQHLAVRVDGEDALMAAKARFERLGVDFQGPIDVDGFVRSIYLWDPNGVRLELTYELDGPEPDKDHDAIGRAALKAWSAEHGRTSAN